MLLVPLGVAGRVRARAVARRVEVVLCCFWLLLPTAAQAHVRVMIQLVALATLFAASWTLRAVLMLGVAAVVAGARAAAAVARNVGRRVTSLVAAVRLFASLVVVVGALDEEMNVAGTSRTCVAFKCARFL